MQYPPAAIALQLTGIVYIHFELTPEDNIKNRCVFKSVHPILDLEALKTLNRLLIFDNPLDKRINFTIPLRFQLR
jgi:TonB family protein